MKALPMFNWEVVIDSFVVEKLLNACMKIQYIALSFI